MQRVPNVERDQLGPEGQAAYDRIAASRGSVRGPFGVLLHHPVLGERVADVGELLRYHGVLPGNVRELAICVTAREYGVAVEWAAHAPLARKEGVSEQALDVVMQRAPTAALAADEALVVDAIRTLFAEHSLTDDQYQRLEAVYGLQGVIELTVLAGYYGLLGFVLNTLRVPAPNGAEPFAQPPA